MKRVQAKAYDICHIMIKIIPLISNIAHRKYEVGPEQMRL
jgi:hypothetical protein